MTQCRRGQRLCNVGLSLKPWVRVKKQTMINTGKSVSRNLPQADGVYNSPSATEQKDAEREWKKGHGPQDHIPAL